MLNQKMTLNEMMSFAPSEVEMAALPLEDVVYIKAFTISMSREDNYDFIDKFFNDSEIKDYINHHENTIIYDFDGSKTTTDEKVISVFEATSGKPQQELAIYLQEQLTSYTHEALVFFIMFTHDHHCFQLSDIDGVIKLEELHDK